MSQQIVSHSATCVTCTKANFADFYEWAFEATESFKCQLISPCESCTKVTTDRGIDWKSPI